MNGTNETRDAGFDEAAIEALSILKEGFERSWAIVIGINDYGGKHATLANAVNDAREVARVLTDVYGFDPVITLYNEQASQEAILAWLLDRLSNNVPPLDDNPDIQVGPNDRVIFFFAGHGATRLSATGTIQQGFLIPQDAKKGLFADYIDMSTLHNACNYINAKHILFVLDCCFSGVAALGTRSEPGLSPQTVTAPYLRRITERKAWQILTAGDKDDKAADSGTRLGNSAFTGVLIDGLEGLADHNKDKLITASDLANYVRVEVINQTAKGDREGQAPFFNYLSGGGQGDFVFVRKGDTPIIRPTSMVNIKVQPLLEQYPWLLWVVVIVLISLVGLAWFAFINGGLREDQINAMSTQMSQAQTEIFKLNQEKITATANSQMTATAVADKAPATQTAVAVAASATNADLEKRGTSVVATSQAVAQIQVGLGVPTSTPTGTPEPPTATPVPTDTPSSTPIPPTSTFSPPPPTATLLACSNEGTIQAAFANINRSAVDRLGCPLETKSDQFAQQNFEHGLIIWRKVPDAVNELLVINKTSGTWQRILITDTTGLDGFHLENGQRCDDPNAPEITQGSVQFAIGGLWCKYKLYEDIGPPTGNELSGAGNVRYQEFSRGALLQEEQNNGIYMLKREGGEYSGSFEIISSTALSPSTVTPVAVFVPAANVSMDITEVTNQEFARFVEATDYETYAEKEGKTNWREAAEGKDNYPVVHVSWTDADQYCRWSGGALPSVEQWAAIALTNNNAFPWGTKQLDCSFANTRYCGGLDPQQSELSSVKQYSVGKNSGTERKTGTSSGIFDLIGNVWEWTADQGGCIDTQKVVAGGSWSNPSDSTDPFPENPYTCRGTTHTEGNLGFRCVYTPANN